MITSTSIFIEHIKKAGLFKGYANFFRGHCNSGYGLSPGIYRHRGYIENEDQLFKETIIRTAHEFSNCRSTIEKLVKMQHYGVPTRLLDITSNPLVALYFACDGDPLADGEVIFMRVPEEDIKFYDSDTVSVISNITKRPFNFSFIHNDKESIKQFNKAAHINYLVHEIREEKSYFQNLVDPKDLKRVIAVKVKLDNPRILKQSGAFLLFGINEIKENAASIPDEWVLNNDEFQLIIPAKEKNAIRRELDLLGINQSTLFPELEHQATYIKERFALSDHCFMAHDILRLPLDITE